MTGILTDDDGDMAVANGQLLLGQPEADIAHRVISAYPGEFKEQPLLGCDIKKQLNGRPDPFWRGEAKKQLKTQHIDATLRFTAEGLEVVI